MTDLASGIGTNRQTVGYDDFIPAHVPKQRMGNVLNSRAYEECSFTHPSSKYNKVNYNLMMNCQIMIL